MQNVLRKEKHSLPLSRNSGQEEKMAEDKVLRFTMTDTMAYNNCLFFTKLLKLEKVEKVICTLRNRVGANIRGGRGTGKLTSERAAPTGKKFAASVYGNQKGRLHFLVRTVAFGPFSETNRTGVQVVFGLCICSKLFIRSSTLRGPENRASSGATLMQRKLAIGSQCIFRDSNDFQEKYRGAACQSTANETEENNGRVQRENEKRGSGGRRRRRRRRRHKASYRGGAGPDGIALPNRPRDEFDHLSKKSCEFDSQEGDEKNVICKGVKVRNSSSNVSPDRVARPCDHPVQCEVISFACLEGACVMFTNVEEDDDILLFLIFALLFKIVDYSHAIHGEQFEVRRDYSFFTSMTPDHQYHTEYFQDAGLKSFFLFYLLRASYGKQIVIIVQHLPLIKRRFDELCRFSVLWKDKFDKIPFLCKLMKSVDTTLQKNLLFKQHI
ncbi:hypothetical protein WN51_07774 [Melipona quadrifasciata]|uniref:Uncharacterized protein n=1 Tax=Melipona quadrifasciata TaxID=166423 RepID=A0A0M9A6R3_9HYME|nr:hypothetical protein WN51_07774 [Melipona quadrifasciata]